MLGSTHASVSYTHLDVYKRQVLWAVCSIFSPFFSPNISRIATISFFPFLLGTEYPNFVCTHNPSSLYARMSDIISSCHSCAVFPVELYNSIASLPFVEVYGSTTDFVGVCLPFLVFSIVPPRNSVASS